MLRLFASRLPQLTEIHSEGAFLFLSCFHLSFHEKISVIENAGAKSEVNNNHKDDEY